MHLELELGSLNLRHGSLILEHGSLKLEHGSLQFEHGSLKLEHGALKLADGSLKFFACVREKLNFCSLGAWLRDLCFGELFKSRDYMENDRIENGWENRIVLRVALWLLNNMYVCVCAYVCW